MSDVIYVVTEDSLAQAYADASCEGCDTGACDVLVDHDTKVYWDLTAEQRGSLMDAADKAVGASTVGEVISGVLWSVTEETRQMYADLKKGG